MKHIQFISDRVERKISAVLPEEFSIDLSGWTGSMTHYRVIFASFMSGSENGYCTVLLAVAAMEDETRLTADEPYKLTYLVLSVFVKGVDNATCFMGHNYNTNK